MDRAQPARRSAPEGEQARATAPADTGQIEFANRTWHYDTRYFDTSVAQHEARRGARLAGRCQDQEQSGGRVHGFYRHRGRPPPAAPTSIGPRAPPPTAGAARARPCAGGTQHRRRAAARPVPRPRHARGAAHRAAAPRSYHGPHRHRTDRPRNEQALPARRAARTVAASR